MNTAHARRKRVQEGLAALVVLLISLTACSTGDEAQRSRHENTVSETQKGEAKSEGPADLIDIKLGAIPIAHTAALMLGIEEGFFAEHGLNIEVEFAAGGAAIVPAVVSGDYQIGYGNITSLILSRTKGLPITMLANSEHAAQDGEADPTHLIVRSDSGIEDAEDLQHRTVAVNTLNAIVYVTVAASIEERGADPGTIKFVEVPFPDMLAALDAGQVDAVAITEPFTTIAERQGDYATIAYPMPETRPGLLVDAYFATDEFIAENPDVVERFQAAVLEANRYAQSNRDKVRAYVPEYTAIDEDIASEIRLPVWSQEEELDRESIQTMAELMVTYGLLDEMPDVSDLIAQ